MEYEQLVQDIFKRFPSVQKEGFRPGAYKPGLEGVRDFDKVLGYPSRAIRTIHIAGTNGKGSVANMLAAALSVAGYRTGLYTSPHLVDFRERCRIDGEMIPREYVHAFLEKWKSYFEAENLSFFEITTGLAFRWFADLQVDFAVIECGLGGRLDSTNIITPVLSVITSIGLDHCSLLGNTLAEIAAEKAGIMKTGVPCVIGETNPETTPVFDAAAKGPLVYADQVEPPLWEHHEEILAAMDLQAPVQRKNLRTVLCALDQVQHHALDQVQHHALDQVQPPCPGDACDANMLDQVQGIKVDQVQIGAGPGPRGVRRPGPGSIRKPDSREKRGPSPTSQSGLSPTTRFGPSPTCSGPSSTTCSGPGPNRCWTRSRTSVEESFVYGIEHAAELMHFHGRWERLREKPLVIADIGHNAHALKSNFEALEATGRPLIIVYGIMADKDLDAIIPLMPRKAKYIFVAPDTPRALPAEVILQKVKDFLAAHEMSEMAPKTTDVPETTDAPGMTDVPEITEKAPEMTEAALETTDVPETTAASEMIDRLELTALPETAEVIPEMTEKAPATTALPATTTALEMTDMPEMKEVPLGKTDLPEMTALPEKSALPEMKTAPSVKAGIKMAMDEATDDSIVYIGGSTFVVAEAL